MPQLDLGINAPTKKNGFRVGKWAWVMYVCGGGLKVSAALETSQWEYTLGDFDGGGDFTTPPHLCPRTTNLRASDLGGGPWTRTNFGFENH
jgi:hypothetical protein